MKVTVKRTANKDGILLELYVNGKRSHYGRDAAGHTSEAGSGIMDLRGGERIYYGDRHYNDFDWAPIDKTAPLTQIANQIRQRIEDVRAWITDCEIRCAEITSEVTFEMPDLGAVPMVNPKQPRDAAGRFCRATY